MFKLFFVITLLQLWCSSSTTAFEDKDIHCPNDQRITSLSKNINGNTKSLNGKCSPFSSPNDASCKKGKALKCSSDQFEACDDQNSYMNGFQIMDLGGNIEMYVPYCCGSSNSKIDKSNCQQKTKLNGNFNYNISSNAFIYRVNCQYIMGNDGKTIKDMSVTFEECTFASTNGGDISHKGSPASDIKANQGGNNKTTTTTANEIDPNMCFTRLRVRNKALDYLEDQQPLNLIANITVSNSNDCANKCYHSEKQLARRCRSFRLQGNICSLRENYIKGDKVQSLPAPIDVVYGNMTNPNCVKA